MISTQPSASSRRIDSRQGIVLMFVSHWIGAIVRGSVLGGLDRTLGLLFGLVRGAALVVFAYILAGVVLPIDRWPPQVLQCTASRIMP